LGEAEEEVGRINNTFFQELTLTLSLVKRELEGVFEIKKIYAIQEKLNNRPRKQLEYRTPNEYFQAFKESEVVHC